MYYFDVILLSDVIWAFEPKVTRRVIYSASPCVHQAELEEPEHVPVIQPALPETVHKKNREDVTDKFGKFDIKPELDCKWLNCS